MNNPPRFYKTYSKKRVMGTNGKLACLVCSKDITAPRRTTFCSQTCVDEFGVKTNADFARRKVFSRDKGVCALCGLDTKKNYGHLWQADHIVPVAEGGGECGLDNLRTLCTDCHKKETADLRKRLAQGRKEQKELREEWHKLLV